MEQAGVLQSLPTFWLDVTRLLTRVGRGALTGVDRVELAYLRDALGVPAARYLCRSTRGYLLLDRYGAETLLSLLESPEDLPTADLFSRLSFRGSRPRHRAEAALRRDALDRCRRGRLSAMVGRAATTPEIYLNVGHSNLSNETLTAFSGRAFVLVHDLIPITHPDTVPDDQPENFAGRLARVRTHARCVLANSEVTARDLRAHWQDHGPQPPIHVCPLGVDTPHQPPATARDSLHFVMLGTIEPRKRVDLMITVWEMLVAEMPAEAMPDLHIIGATGWKVDPLMQRLATHPLLGRYIHHHGPLPDAEVAQHLGRAGALLFPSRVEGYGYPPIEAALSGAIPICSNLEIFGETLGDCAIYVESDDPYQWKEVVKRFVMGDVQKPDLARLSPPRWTDHLRGVVMAYENSKQVSRG